MDPAYDGLSLLSIASGIKDGSIQPQQVPPKLRNRVLMEVLDRRLIKDPMYMARFSSIDFWIGMESVNTELGGYELEYLLRLQELLAIELPNHATIGDGITCLMLSVYGCTGDLGSGTGSPIWVQSSSFPLVSRFIAQCPNTTSLAFNGIFSTWVLEELQRNHQNVKLLQEWFPSILNETGMDGIGVVENLTELSLRHLDQVLQSDSPFIVFKNLTSLKLENCSFSFDAWQQFLVSIPTLERLHLLGVSWIPSDLDMRSTQSKRLDAILPISMPNLQVVEIVAVEDNQYMFVCSKAFVDNLAACTKLRQLQVSLDEKSTDEDSLIRLANLNIDLKVKFSIVIFYAERALSAVDDTCSMFKVVRIFNDRIDSLDIRISCKYGYQFTPAVVHAIETCCNLTKFTLLLPDESVFKKKVCLRQRDLGRINTALIRAIRALVSKGRANFLKCLRLSEKFDEAVIDYIFQGCPNIDHLDLSDITSLQDRHLLNWLSVGGGYLSYLKIAYCPSVSNDAILAVLAKCGDGLYRFVFNVEEDIDGEHILVKAVRSLCPNAKFEW